MAGQSLRGIPHAGIDAAEISRITRAVERWEQRFLDRVYTTAEQRYCGRKMQRLAGRFAAKEAISKVLGTGVRYVRWREMEILPDRRGKPVVYLYGRAAQIAHALDLGPISVSITHTGDLALAFAVGLGGQQTSWGDSVRPRPEDTSDTGSPASESASKDGH